MSADLISDVIRRAIAARIFPAAAAAAGPSGGFFFSEVFGALTFDEDSKAAAHDVEFDLASITKPIATTSVVMQLVDNGRLRLDAPVADFFPGWRGRDREQVTVQDLLEHASGLPARLLDSAPETRREFEHDICTMPLEYEPRTKSVYSDLDFILLGLLVEQVGGARLDELFERITRIGTVHLEPAEHANTYRTVSESPFGFAID